MKAAEPVTDPILVGLTKIEQAKVWRLADAFRSGQITPAMCESVTAGLGPVGAVQAVDRLLDEVGA